MAENTNKVFLSSVDIDRVCHSCKQPVNIQVDLTDPDKAETLDGIQVCLSYECKNCGSEEMYYQDPYGGGA